MRISTTLLASLLFLFVAAVRAEDSTQSTQETVRVSAASSIGENKSEILRSLEELDDRKNQRRTLTKLRNSGLSVYEPISDLIRANKLSANQWDGVLSLLRANLRAGRDCNMASKVVLDQLTQHRNRSVAKQTREILGPDYALPKSCRGKCVIRGTLVSQFGEEQYASYTAYDMVAKPQHRISSTGFRPDGTKMVRDYQRIRVWKSDDYVVLDAEGKSIDYHMKLTHQEFEEQFPQVAQRVAAELNHIKRRSASEPESRFVAIEIRKHCQPDRTRTQCNGTRTRTRLDNDDESIRLRRA